MRQVRWASWLMVGALGVTLGGLQPVGADVTSDRAAAIVNYPLILVENGVGDTVIQLTNASTDPVNVHCFYENANSHCTNDGSVCTEAANCCSGGSCGVCQPGWNETDFRVRLTPLQPMGWLASEGMSSFKIDGLNRTGVGGSSNAGSRIPPVAEEPFIGMLKCIAVDDNENPIDRNVLTGVATIETLSPFDVLNYNAVGIQAISGANNSDKTLVLGGEGAEYNGCPNVIILDHFFEFAVNPVSGAEVQTLLVLMPCTEDFLRQVPGKSVVQYLVYNEFEQRFSTSRTVDCQQALYLSDIDTSQPTRSIFSAGVAGTLTGQSRLTPLGSGLLAVAVETHDDNAAGFNVHYQGDRAASDLITLP